MKLCPRCSEPYPDESGFCPLDGSALVPSADPLLGRVLAARYRLVRPLGRGGMAVVYLARHVLIDRLSAIKILRSDLALQPLHRERFLREARAVNRINHPNIVEITDYGEDGGLVYLVMEYVEGQSLTAALAGGPFPWQQAAEIALRIASALGRAHELGVIHRDLKPENVLLAPGPVGRGGPEYVKLTDFGIAKVVNAPSITVAEQRFGTPGYIAPEYILGAPADARGDLYSLGVLLYEMLTRKLPFDAQHATELLVLATREAPIKPSARIDGIPPELESLVLQMIARRPEDRPNDAFVIHDALADLVRRPSGAPSRPGRPTRDEGNGAISTREQPAVPMQGSPRSQLTAELATIPSSEIEARWRGMMTDAARLIDQARRARGDGDPAVRRAEDLAAHAREAVGAIERARATASDHQAHVDRLEAHGRAFRATLGHAIDTLSHDRSRERARIGALGVLRDAIDEDATMTKPGVSSSEHAAAQAAAIDGETAVARATEADLGYQIQELERQLDAHNEQLEADLGQATGKLEGALSAVRRMSSELLKTLEEAVGTVG